MYPDEDQACRRGRKTFAATFESILEQVSKNNPAAKALFDVPVNQEQMLAVLAPELTPAARVAADEDAAGHQCAIGAGRDDGTESGTAALGSSCQWNRRRMLTTSRPQSRTMREFRQDNFQLRIDNPLGWARLDAYYEMLEDLDMQVGKDQAQRTSAVQQAGSPQPPQQPQQMAVLQELQQLAASMAERLAAIANMDPAMTGGTVTGQVAAAMTS